MDPGSSRPRTRVVIFTNDDRVWYFPAWKAALPRLVDRHEVLGIFLFRPSRRRELRFFLHTFGLRNFLLFAAYALRVSAEQCLSGLRSWKDLAARYSLELRRARSPNEAAVASWIRQHQIDVILLSVDQILKGEILKAPHIGIINKHAALLPACRGVYPYMWARLNGLPTGITFHAVDAGIDTGPLLIQQRYPRTKHQVVSMLRFYMDVYSLFPEMLSHAVDALLEQRFAPSCPELPESYHTFPTRHDVLQYEKVERVARISDLFYRPPRDLLMREAEIG